jgi:hypothetical protein
MSERLLKTPAMAERADVTPLTAKRWRAIGYGPAWIRLRGERGEVRYPESEFEKWVQENLNSSLADEYSKRPQDDSEQEAPSTPKGTPTFSMKDGRRAVRSGA